MRVERGSGEGVGHARIPSPQTHARIPSPQTHCGSPPVTPCTVFHVLVTRVQNSAWTGHTVQLTPRSEMHPTPLHRQRFPVLLDCRAGSFYWKRGSAPRRVTPTSRNATRRARPAETKAESGTSQSKSGTSVTLMTFGGRCGESGGDGRGL